MKRGRRDTSIFFSFLPALGRTTEKEDKLWFKKIANPAILLMATNKQTDKYPFTSSSYAAGLVTDCEGRTIRVKEGAGGAPFLFLSQAHKKLVREV